MKRILKKYWILFIISLLFLLFIGNYILAPKITIINNSDIDIKIKFNQYLGFIEEGNLQPVKDDVIVAMAREKSISLKRGEKKIFRVNLFDLNDKNESVQTDVVEVYWNDIKGNLIVYEIIKENKNKSTCSMVITVEHNNKYIFEEDSDGFCLRRIAQVLYLTSPKVN